MVETLLIANRGEIACRIIRTARAMGIRTVAVFSEADRGSLHAAMADLAVAVGPAPAAESYLSITRILEAAARSGADAIHPGYGFLSENADFAEAVAAAGLTFIGPPASAIRAMGNKAQAKRLMMQAGVPCLPGAEDGDDAALLKAASAIGFPVMVKAAAGGGGRGMRLVRGSGELASAISSARSEAFNAFGSGELILEKAVSAGRHVEIQILADNHGHTVHLFERDCSAQRRHQKVIEEAPSPAVTQKLREAMGEAAVAAGRAVGYEGAGTVEFLLEDGGNFHFLEMNTRLQVEHPVTEMITGLDLVQLQIEIARGGKLPFSQDDLRPNGHAIEARLYAEDPASGFLPSPGRVALFAEPSGAGIRVDTGIASGEAIPPNYDAMIAKVIAHGATREEARQRLVRALGSTAVFGIASNRDFLMALLESAEFAAGETRTSTIATLFGERFAGRPSEAEDAALAGVAVYIARRDAALLKAPPIAGELLGWSSTGSLRSALRLAAGEAVFDVSITDRHGVLDVETGSGKMRFSSVRLSGGRLSGERDGVRFSLPCIASSDEAWIALADRVFRFAEPQRQAPDAVQGGRITAPMHGRIVDVFVKEGETVEAGSRLCMLEAMKMQHAIVSTGPGNVGKLAVREDMQVSAGDVLMEIGDGDA
jgi:geranyl-CoA carboxylase alpha subunit